MDNIFSSNIFLILICLFSNREVYFTRKRCCLLSRCRLFEITSDFCWTFKHLLVRNQTYIKHQISNAHSAVWFIYVFYSV